MDLKDIYRTFHLTAKGYALFSSLHRTFPKIDHILDHKTNLTKFKSKSLKKDIPCKWK